MTLDYQVANDVICLEDDLGMTGLCVPFVNFTIVDSISWNGSPPAVEFQLNGVFGLGRPNTTDIASQNFLVIAFKQNYLLSTAYASEPSQNYYFPIISLGGYDESLIVGGALNWVFSPADTTNPDAWPADLLDIVIAETHIFNSTSTSSA
jgi:hypothetical protein